jgi:Xaa-Pro aminopeptidase
VYDRLLALLNTSEPTAQGATVVGAVGVGLYASKACHHLIPAETLALEAGMVLTIEPGIYIPSWGGMGLEGSYVIAEGGARRLDRFPSDLMVC